MERFNYRHLHYFWMTAREGGIARASAKLHLSQPSISAQIKQLEDALGVKLFQKHGRSLVLTDVGRVVHHYAEEIFGAGRDLMAAVKSSQPGRSVPLTIGVSNAVPKLVICRLLRPLLQASQAPRIVCKEDNTERLLGELATHAIDVLFADTPALPHVRVKVFNHVLGRSDTGFFASSGKLTGLKKRFPQSLHGARMVLPTPNTALRRDLDTWFDMKNIKPDVIGEFEDPALMKVVGADSGALFPAPMVIVDDVRRVYDATLIGRTADVQERYYAISAERRLTHPGIVAITSAAQDRLFK